MEKRGGAPGFGPVYAPCAGALILGSYPSTKSFEEGFYYGHPRNRFWPLLAALAGRPAPADAGEKRALVVQSGLALWDVLESCSIEGASDASITSPVVNDVAGLVKRLPVRAVFCNGRAAWGLYQRHCRPHTGLDAMALPSTSPANAAFSFRRLLEAWAPVGEYVHTVR